MVAATPGDDGPLVAYMTFDAQPAPQALAWPPEAMHGFNAVSYSTSAGDLERLARDSQDDGLPRDWMAGSTSPFTARFELWRAPGAPARLAVALGQTPGRAIAHLENDTRMQLALCPTFPHTVRPLGKNQK
jgi:hypothetical protein